MEKTLKGPLEAIPLKILAEEAYLERQYQESTRTYSKILSQNEDDLESKVGLLLADMAMDHEDESRALYEYYQILKNQEGEEAHRIILSLVESFDGNINELASVTNAMNGMSLDAMRGIRYQDFLQAVKDRGDFRRTFEDLMFSSRVIISSKNEFIEFLELLVQHGLREMAMHYIETIDATTPWGVRLRELYDKAGRDA